MSPAVPPNWFGHQWSVTALSQHKLEDRVRQGLSGNFNAERYGLPFVGDNQFLIDRLEETEPRSAHWYEIISNESESKLRPHTTRMTAWIDRADMSRTVSHLYAPLEQATPEIPASAWTAITPN